MTQQVDIPGMDQGMFFEYYVFEPRTNYTEKDIHHIVRFIDILFNDDVEPPHLKHFDGKVFKPQEDITVSEFADILTAMKIQISLPVAEKLPKSLQAHFDSNGLFIPYDDFELQDLNAFIIRFLLLRINTVQFNTLPRNIQKHFIVFTRDGKTWRFGDRPAA